MPGDELPFIDLPSPTDFAAEQGTVEPVGDADVGQATDIGWEFCLLFSGRPWQTVVFQADSAAEAAGWIEAYTHFVNTKLAELGYPRDCTWRSGACQP